MHLHVTKKSADQNLYSKLIDSIGAIVWEADPETTQVTFVSPIAERILGYPLSEWHEPGFWINHVHPDDRDWVDNFCKVETLAGRSHDFEYRMIAKDGGVVWIHDIVTVGEENGRLSLRGLMIDITDKKRVEQERLDHLRLLESLNRISLAVQQATTEDYLIGAVLEIAFDALKCDRAWLAFPCNSSARSVRIVMERSRFGIPGDFTKNSQFVVNDQVAILIRKLLTSNDPLTIYQAGGDDLFESCEDKYHAKAQMLMAVCPKLSDSYAFGVDQCCSDRVWTTQDRELFKQIGQRLADALTTLHVQKMLRDNNIRFRAIFDHAIDSMYIHKAGGKIIDVNQQGCDKLGYSKDEILGNLPTLFDYELSSERLLEYSNRLSRGHVVNFQSKHKRKDGSIFPVEVWLKGFWIDGERLSVSLVRDLSERLRLEEQFRQAQKMEAVGRLAGGMAHDFNNLLTVIGGYCELILSNNFPDHIKEEFVVEIKKAHDRATDLTQQLLSFSRRKLMQPQEVDVNARLAELRSLLERVIGEDVVLQISPLAENATAKIDAGQFEHAIVNLVVNARDAMPDGGEIHITTRNISRADRFYPPGSALEQCQHIVEIAISDTGCGIEENARSRLFEPFFTTKAPGKGTGLGLAMVYGFVQQSGGEIQVDSQVGKGTTFLIYLPASGAEPTEAATSPIVSSSAKGTETVLLVEDEQSVRELTAMTLRTHGYEVLIACDGQEGLSIANAFKGRIDLLISDMVMPQMNGLKLAETLVAQRPEMRVLFISGYLEHSDEAKSNIKEFGYCPKPFTPSALLEKIQDTLVARSTPNQPPSSLDAR